MEVYRLVRKAVEESGIVSATKLLAELKGSGYQLPARQTIQRWIFEQASPFSGKNLFSPLPCEELSFYIGAWLGDGWGDENDGGKRMLLKVRSYDFAKEFADCAAKVLGKKDSYWVRRVIDSRGKWYLVKVTSFMLYDFLSKPLDSVLEVAVKNRNGFLRGFFTAEGNPTASIETLPKPYLSIGVTASNSNRRILDFARSLLVDGGYHPGKIRVNIEEGKRTNVGIASSDGLVFTLSKFHDVQRFASEIGFADSEKQSKMNDAIRLLSTMNRYDAAIEWRRAYKKVGKRWARISTSSS
jgi:intein-encoded DNA endonuclease-like protein